MYSLNRKTNQAGRSMVEMLGVLAIIGVLSVGGLTIYKYTMRRHRITTTIQQVALAMQSARGLALKKIDAGDDLDANGCLSNINWIIQGAEPCDGDKKAFKTAIGACVSVCRDERNIWYMDIEFDTNNDPDNIITQSDCENILMSEISKDGFLDNDMNFYNHDSESEITSVCNLFAQSNSNDTKED